MSLWTHDRRDIHSHDQIDRWLVKEVRAMLDFGAYENIGEHDSTLGEIMHLIDMPFGVTSVGWNRESARLFSIDIAMTALHRNLPIFSEPERQSLLSGLQEARTLAVSGRDPELGFIQAALESHLPFAQEERQRRIWIIGIDALMPNPFRAALISTRNAISLGTNGTLTEFSTILKDRLLARLGEGSLHREPGPLTA